MMNCLEFRRRKLADPRRLEPEAQAHASGCPACAGFAREVDEGERALDRALTVPVPDGLAERLIFESRRPRAGWRAWALAAGVLIAVALGVAYWTGVQRSGDDYARHAIEHVVLEPESLAAVRNADAAAFRAVVQELGGAVKDLPGKIRYIRLCPFEGALGWHVVFETPEGLATLFLVPGKKPPSAQTAAVKGWSASVQPLARGYYAVVTPSSSATARFLKALRDCIAWTA
jgi:hypothetical protein